MWDGPLNRVDGGYEIPADYRGKSGELRMRVPGRVIADDALMPHILEDLAMEQVANVASLPGIVGHALAMPDIHWGYGFPIGGVAAFGEDGIVSPGGVGFDINCGVRLLVTDLDEATFRKKHRLALDTLFARVPAGMGSRGGGVSDDALGEILVQGAAWAQAEGIVAGVDRDHMEDRGRIDGAETDVGERAWVRGRRSLGSLGSGNHFLEVQVVDELMGEAATDEAAFGLMAGQIVIMIHSGSRGLGHQVCQDHVGRLQTDGLVDRQLAYAPLGSDEAEAYLGAMNAAANFAYVNRSILAQRATGALREVFPGVEVATLWDVCHNIAKWEEHHVPGGGRQRVLVHRKGATRAFAAGHESLPDWCRDVGQPVLVPGDMGRASYVLAAQPGAMKTTFGSCCHGAGRRMSRSAAKREYQGARLIEELGRQGIIVKATSAQVAAEEAPGAYKDVSQVVAAVAAAGIARPVARLRPLGVVKG